MEKEAQDQQPSTIDSNINPPVSTAKTFNQQKLMVIALVVIALLAFGIGGYFLGARKNTSNSMYKQSSEPTSIPITQISPTSNPTELPIQGSLPSDWTLKSSTACNVKIPTPPNKAPYFENLGGNNSQNASNPQYRRFWQLREGKSQSKSNDGNSIFTAEADMMYVADIEASDYVAGLVRVRCAPTNQQYTLNTLPDVFVSGYGTDAGIKVRNKKQTTMWGRDVIVSQFDGGLFGDTQVYFLMTKDSVYAIDKKADSSKRLVKDATDKIFANLQFTD